MNRPDLARLLADVRAGKIRALYVTKLDRLTRRLTDLLEIVKILERHGCALISASETVDTSTPAGRMMLQLLGVFAEFERARIGERTADVLGDRRRRGKVYTGVTPFGYTRDGDELLPNPAQLAALDEAKAMLDDGASLRQVGSFLVRCVGGRWHPQTVKDVLSSRIARERTASTAS